MKILSLLALAVSTSLLSAPAAAQGEPRHHAGAGHEQALPKAATLGSQVRLEHFSVPNGAEPPLPATIWIPSAKTKGRRLPLVLISHGGGGSRLGHAGTAEALARSGMVVAALDHAGDTTGDEGKVLMLWRRPAQLRRLLDFMLGPWSGRDLIDPHRVGAFGFSNGGFTVLAAAGGRPQLARIDTYCRQHSDHDLCGALRRAGISSVKAIVPPPDAWRRDHRIKSIAVSAPAFAFTFDRAGLSAVRIPVQLWRAGRDRQQPHPWYEAHLETSLPVRPDYRVVERAGHYAFLPPCTRPARELPAHLCKDTADFDRSAFHREFNAELSAYFRRTLQAHRQ